MKILFPLPGDSVRHRFCQNCYSENLHDILVKGKKQYECYACKGVYDRLIDIDPKLVWWIDKQTKEYWHESVGVFVSNYKKKLLLIERTIYPYGFTIPAGHLEKGEQSESAALRELKEETGIKSSNLIHFKNIELENDPCRRGADKHKWHVYKHVVQENIRIEPDLEEGKNPIWITVEEALTKNLTQPVKYLLEKFGKDLTG